MTSQKLFALSANRLTDGLVVFLRQDGTWTTTNAGLAISKGDSAELEAKGAPGVASQIIVDPYPFEIEEIAPGQIRAIKFREQIRLLGPTVRMDLGKQAGN